MQSKLFREGKFMFTRRFSRLVGWLFFHRRRGAFQIQWFPALRLRSRQGERAQLISALDRNRWCTRPRMDTLWWWDGHCCAAHFLPCCESVCLKHVTGFYNRFLLEPGHANMCGVEWTHRKLLHFSSGDPRGEITMSTRNTSSAKSAWTFVLQLSAFHHCVQLIEKKSIF